MADIYEHDLRTILSVFGWLSDFDHAPREGVYVGAGSRLVVESKNDYTLGTLECDGDQWRFTPYEEGTP